MYRHLSRGKTLKESFHIAELEVLHQTEMSRKVAQEEMGKILLLGPEGCPESHHDVAIFSAPGTKKSAAQCTETRAGVPFQFRPPLPTKLFLGRQQEQFELIRHLGESLCRVVWVSGAEGKSALVTACCYFLAFNNRMIHSFDLHDIVWFTYDLNQQDRCLQLQSPYGHVKHILSMIRNANVPAKTFLQLTQSYIEKVIEYMGERKALWVIDAKDMANQEKASKQESAFKLISFVQEVIKRTNYLKIWIIHQNDANLKSKEVHETDFILGPLKPIFAIQLFEEFLKLRHKDKMFDEGYDGIPSRETLCNLLHEFRKKQQGQESILDDISRLIGQSPSSAWKNAKHLTVEVVIKLLVLIKKGCYFSIKNICEMQ
jgi:hypothetical protein